MESPHSNSDIYNLSNFASKGPTTNARAAPPPPLYPGVRRSKQIPGSTSDSPISPSVGFFRQRTETVSSTCSGDKQSSVHGDRRLSRFDGRNASPEDDSPSSPPPRFTNSDNDKTRRKRKHKRSATLSPTGRMRSRESSASWSRAKRDALLSPSSTQRTYERRSSVRSISPACAKLASPAGAASIAKRPDLPSSMRPESRRGKLRKTFSEPTEIFVDQRDTQKVERVQDILSSLNFRKFRSGSSNSYIMPSSSFNLMNSNSGSFITGRSSSNQSATCLDQDIWATPHGSFVRLTKKNEKNIHRRSSMQKQRLSYVEVDSESDVIATDIEELKEAAQSIELLSRRNRRNPGTPPSIDPLSSAVDSTPCCSQSAGIMPNTAAVPPILIPGPGSTSTSAPSSASLNRKSGITTRLGGHPRGVMQFLPSVKSSEFLSKTAYETYIANKIRREQISNQSGTEESDTCSPPGTLHLRQSSADIYDMSYMRSKCESAYQYQQSLKRKTSVPDQFYSIEPRSRINDAMDMSMFDSDSTEPSGLTMPTLPPKGRNIQERKNFSDEEWLANQMASTQTLLIPQSSSYQKQKGRRTRKVSAPVMDDRLSRLGRFASFAATGMRPITADNRSNSTTRASSSRKLSRQYSTHANSSDNESSSTLMPIKGSESLAGFSRFGRLLRSLRASRQNSPETDNALSPASSESPLSSPSAHERYNARARIPEKPHMLSHHGSIPSTPSLSISRSWHDRPAQHKILNAAQACVTSDSDSSMLQADIMLWRKRSRGSLRKHEVSPQFT